MGLATQPDPIAYGLAAGQPYLRILDVASQPDPRLLGLAGQQNSIVLLAIHNNIGSNFAVRFKYIESAILLDSRLLDLILYTLYIYFIFFKNIIDPLNHS